jgi:peptidoglycan biosynthesis protein MviN/MurJ (putative lipid II flippase)
MFSRAVNNLRTIAVYLHVANNMNVDDIVGLIGGFILGVQLLPQIYGLRRGLERPRRLR